MLTSLALIFLMGLSLAAVCRSLGLPGIIGMLAAGVLLGPYALDLLDPSVLGVSAELRQMALVIILIKAGLSLNIADLKRVGRPALLMSFLPAAFEITGYTLFAPWLLGVTRLEAAMMGAALGAVSPAIVVPKMVQLIESGYGAAKGIPQMILAGASLDDVFVIALFTTFVGMAGGGSASVMELAAVPVSIVLGILLGAAAGFGLALFFETAFVHQRLIRNSVKMIVVLGAAFLLLAVESWLKGIAAISGLLAVMSMACALRLKCVPRVSQRLAEKFGKLWLAAEVVLFVLVGAAVDIRYTLGAGLPAVALIFLALLFRGAGVCLCLTKTSLTPGERLFCVIAYLPKATVQAAICSIPLSLGLPCGKLILSVAVLGILITAPLGALGMEASAQKLLISS